MAARFKPNLLQILLGIAVLIGVVALWSRGGGGGAPDRVIPADELAELTVGPPVILSRDARDVVGRVVNERDHRPDRTSFRLRELTIDGANVVGMWAFENGDAFYVQERDGTLHTGNMGIGSPRVTERIDLGVAVASFQPCQGCFALVLAEREAIWTIDRKSFTSLSGFEVPDLEAFSAESGNDWGVAVAGGRDDPHRRRLVLLDLKAGKIIGAWTAGKGDWSIMTADGERRLGQIDHVAMGRGNGSVHVLDGVNLWRLQYAEDGELVAHDFEPNVLREAPGQIATRGKWAMPFGDRGGMRGEGPERRLQTRDHEYAPIVEAVLPDGGAVTAVEMADRRIFVGFDRLGLWEFGPARSNSRVVRQVRERVPKRRIRMPSDAGRFVAIDSGGGRDPWVLVHTENGLYVAD